jgi:hypothetical protein
MVFNSRKYDDPIIFEQMTSPSTHYMTSLSTQIAKTKVEPKVEPSAHELAYETAYEMMVVFGNEIVDSDGCIRIIGSLMKEYVKNGVMREVVEAHYPKRKVRLHVGLEDIVDGNELYEWSAFHSPQHRDDSDFQNKLSHFKSQIVVDIFHHNVKRYCTNERVRGIANSFVHNPNSQVRLNVNADYVEDWFYEYAHMFFSLQLDATFIQDMTPFANLRHLSLRNGLGIRNLDRLVNLKTLTLNHCSLGEQCQENIVPYFEHLEEIEIYDFRHLTDVSTLSHLKEVKIVGSLYLNDITPLKNVSAVKIMSCGTTVNR